MNDFKKAVIYATLILYSGMILFPVFITYSSSFREASEMFKAPLELPKSFNISNYRKVLQKTNFLWYLANSTIVTGASIFFSLVLGTMAAYGLARYDFKITRYLYFFLLMGLIVPIRLASLPLFILMRNLGLLDTRLSLIIVYTAWRIAFTVLIMQGFFSSLPKDLEDAGRADGCNEFQLFYKIMLPLAKPGFVIAAVYNAVPVWNDFFFPLIFIRSDRLNTLTLAVSNFFGEYSVAWGQVFAFLGLTILPIITLYVVMSKQFIKGMTAGAFD